ncbi:cytochrome P450 [Anabaena sp. FACHB-1237]|uniref:cytochrome P450 n=1 Tax=Anabaena sp. FACHB-1237 TaxID=2692769 RepID=UPI001680F89F|nr:cytochrome P450 [Anabaena sp. FACHB-1237]MBD2136408.1 cytochrome P450 [Anabaena sp. FACHB-1237]
MSLPKGPQTPAFLQFVKWITTPLSFQDECVKKYGDIFTLRFDKNTPPIVIVSNPQALQTILTHDIKELTAPGELNQAFSLLLGQNSVITLSGTEHQRQRQLLMPSLHGERMKNYTNIINNITKEVINQQPVNQPFSARALTQNITLKVIMSAVFGIKEGLRSQKLEALIKEILDQGTSIFSAILLHIPALQQSIGNLSLWGKQVQRQEAINQIIYTEIQERRNKLDSSRNDIFTLLLQAQDENGEFMTDVELRDELITLLTAGHETTATALSWALYWIYKNPEILEKLQAEIDSLPDNTDINTIFKLPYLNAVYCETLRIYPVGMSTFPRIVEKPISIGGYELEIGTIVMGSIYLTHHREDIYPQPQKFNPERFLEKQFSPYQFLPFGGGARRCIGLAFAQMEMKLAIFTIVKHWELELIPSRDILPQRRGLTIGQNREIKMLLKGSRSSVSRNSVKLRFPTY